MATLSLTLQPGMPVEIKSALRLNVGTLYLLQNMSHNYIFIHEGSSAPSEPPFGHAIAPAAVWYFKPGADGLYVRNEDSDANSILVSEART